MPDLNTPEDTRSFLALCLDPGYGVKRTVNKLADVMPPWLRERVDQHAPHLAQLHAEADRLQAAADEARAAYAAALGDWIQNPITAAEEAYP
ncbi:hypothetical protein [Streptomyces chryseus]|uniref:Uncharacterized protein n=2 Tax=Streptomyces chryseus TaxID=68186 RepID=A0ABQ3DM80_9ACTN|nr:hypothetical protein [Streptomyces chryseus]GHA94164.1 hypothetical protein GCM10010346_16130 [Streptomyces chryseus]